MAKIIKRVYLDPPSTEEYRFRANPPFLGGQIGVPELVDKLLGTLIRLISLI